LTKARHRQQRQLLQRPWTPKIYSLSEDLNRLRLRHDIYAAMVTLREVGQRHPVAVAYWRNNSFRGSEAIYVIRSMAIQVSCKPVKKSELDTYCSLSVQLTVHISHGTCKFRLVGFGRRVQYVPQWALYHVIEFRVNPGYGIWNQVTMVGFSRVWSRLVGFGRKYNMYDSGTLPRHRISGFFRVMESGIRKSWSGLVGFSRDHRIPSTRNYTLPITVPYHHI
jgi:hypothetical protein